MDHAGVLAHSAVDVALLLGAFDGRGRQMSGDLTGLRVGVVRNPFFTAAPDITALVDDALDVFGTTGAHIVDVDVDHLEHCAAAASVIILAEASAYHEDWLGDRGADYGEQVKAFLDLGTYVLATDYLRAQRFRTLLAAEFARVFSEVDVVVTPALPVAAPVLGAPTVSIGDREELVFETLLHNTEPFNLLGLPAAVGPCGFTDDGLPASIQIVGPAHEDERVLNALDAYQQATDWHLRRPARRHPDDQTPKD